MPYGLLSQACHTFCNCRASTHGSLLCPAKPLHSFRHHGTEPTQAPLLQKLVSPPAAVFLLACGQSQAAGLSQFLYRDFAFPPSTVAKAKAGRTKTKTPPAPCVFNIGRIRIRTSCSHASTCACTRGRLAAQCPQTVPLRYTICSHFPNASSRLYNLRWVSFPQENN